MDGSRNGSRELSQNDLPLTFWGKAVHTVLHIINHRPIIIDDRCTVHDLSNGKVIIVSGILCRGLYKLIDYERSINYSACAIQDSQAISDAKIWHARFGHLNFASLLRLQKSEMVSSLPKLEAPRKHVYEGCILGKMQRSSFPKYGSVRATQKLQLVHSDVCGPMQTRSLGKYLTS